MADWGGIARAVEEGLMDAESGGSSSGGGIRDIAEALTGSNFAGFKVRDIFDKDRWTRRERVNQGRRLEETGIPDYTYDYNPTDRGVTTGLGPDNSPVATPIGDPSTWGDSPKKNTIDNVNLHPDFMARATPGEIDYELAVARGEVDYDKSGMPGLGAARSARRERAMRNMSIRDRQEAGFGEGPYSEFDRISRSHGTRHDAAMDRHRQGQIRARRAHRLAQLALGNTSGTPGMGGHPSQGIGSPDWAALEEDMARRAMREDPFMGRDER